MREPTDLDDDFIPNEPELDEAQEAARREEEEIVAAYCDTFKTQAGRKVMAHMKALYHDEVSHTPGDPYTTAYKDGCRGVYLQIEKILRMK